MKKYIKNIILVAFSASLLVGCQTELDEFNVNPNDPSTSNPKLLLSAMELGTFQTHSSGVMRFSGVFTQHLQGTSIGQFGAVGLYVVNEGDVNNEWNLIYGTTLMNGHILNRDFAKDYPYYNGIGQILSAINLGYATDMWGDVPYDDAFLAEETGNKFAKYNTQQEIYDRIQGLLDKALANFQKPLASNEEVPSKADFIFNGDIQKWTKVAYVLKARYALRLTAVNASNAQKALDYITLAGMTSNSDDANTLFLDKPNSWNQWFAFENGRENYIKMGKYFVDYLVNNDDPRLPFMVGEDVNGNYTGNAVDDIDSVKTSYIAGFGYPDDNNQYGFASADWQIGIVTYAEAKFIEAEAKALLGQSGAQTALQDAVTASVTKITKAAPSAPFLAAATADFTVAGIIQQKYIAMFLTMEPYNDYRRTGFPALTPNPKSDTKLIPVRLPTPSDERQYNPNATVVSNVTTKVWWDKN